MGTNQSNQAVSLPVDGIPMPIVNFNRWILVLGVGLGLILQQPILTTMLLLLLLPAVVGGQRWSLIAIVGRWLFARQISRSEREDRGLMRFNNTIAVVLLGLAQIAFAFGLPLLGWIFALMVAVAASIALAGFCIGCFLYYQFKMRRSTLLNR